MKRLQRLLILLLTVVFVLPLFPISAAASGWSMFPWSMVFGDSAEQAYQEEYDSEPDYGYVDPYAYGDTVNEYADPDDFGQPVDAGDTVSSYYGDAYGGTFDGDSSSSDDTAIENEATAPGANDAGPNKEDKDAEEKDGDIQAEQDGLTEQTITAAQPKPTNDILSFKEMLANRLDRLSSAAPARDQLPDVTITIRGHLPYGATAKARYFSADEDERFDGSALFAYEITIYDAFGAVYRPASELTVTVTSPLIDTALQDGMEVTVLRCTGNDGETEEVGSESSGDLCRFRTRELPARFVFATDRPCRTVFSEYLPEPDRSAGEGGSQVTVSGALPAGVTAEVRPVSPYAYDVELGRPLLTFDVTLYRGGAEYQPDADRPATVTVRSSRIASALDDGYAIAVWHIDEDGGCQRVSDISARGDAVSFTACEFSPYVLGLAAREIDVFADAYVEASLLGIDDCFAPQWDGSVEPELGDGLELVDACEVDCAGEGLWLDVTLTDEPDLGELESLTLYGLADGELVESVSAEITGAGEIAAIALDEADGFALVKDTGLRSRSLTVNPEQDESVTISGRIPTDATVTAVTAPEAEDAVCAYDISLLNNGKEYQPGEDNPMTVTIHNPAIADAVAAGRELAL
ncbi:MAG: hypothetical protein IIY40_02410, partial [Firmicutes bacterium]|nr:hypothetical protein [Bacillota bacterium]